MSDQTKIPVTRIASPIRLDGAEVDQYLSQFETEETRADPDNTCKNTHFLDKTKIPYHHSWPHGGIMGRPRTDFHPTLMADVPNLTFETIHQPGGLTTVLHRHAVIAYHSAGDSEQYAQQVYIPGTSGMNNELPALMMETREGVYKIWTAGNTGVRGKFCTEEAKGMLGGQNSALQWWMTESIKFHKRKQEDSEQGEEAWSVEEPSEEGDDDKPEA
jgi:hypothetical protein